jgi:hypothetical protein
MIVIPPNLLARFESILTKRSVFNELRNYYKKWLLFPKVFNYRDNYDR